MRPAAASLTVVRANGFSRRGAQLCRRVGDLRIGAERTLELTTRATRSTPRRITNTASARADNARRARARASVDAPAPCAPAARRAARVASAAC